jgi:RHS repeat-associated protein
MSYSYDYLSRLNSSTFHNYSDAGVISGTNNYNENLTYDLRGNIQTLQRTGFYTNGSTCTYGQIDNLTYSYTANTNRLHKVLDGTLTAGDAKSRGFNGNLSTVDNSMTYDRNGNLNKNLHKNVSTITYNHLNLPTVITFTTGNTIEFLYDAAGTKLRKTVKVGATVQYIQDYLPGGIEYRHTGTGVKRVESVFHAEGRYYNTNVDVSSTLAWRKEYNFKDHLGNTRLVFTDRNANGIVDITGTASTSDVLQENHYYAFGLAFEGAWLQNDATARDNAYQYNGKELNSDFGLGWTDYGARWYDAGIGRWNAVDPLLEKYTNSNPFNYCSNNPILKVDPNGMENITYIHVLPGSKINRKEVEKLANQFFNHLGLKRIVKFIEGPIKQENFDETDNLAIIGSMPKDVVSFMKNGIGGDMWDAGDMVEYNEWSNSIPSGYPEQSHLDGRLVGVSTTGAAGFAQRLTKAGKNKGKGEVTASEMIAFLIVHGTGHNASASHTDSGLGRAEAGFMMRGDALIGSYINNVKVTNLRSFFNLKVFDQMDNKNEMVNGRSQGGIITYMKSYLGGYKSPVDNYTQK